jgi:hypothetical protein
MQQMRIVEMSFRTKERAMKRRITSMIEVGALMLALSFPMAALAAPPASKPQPKAAASPAQEPHPEIHEAIESLRHAREHLNHANHDFGGHRADAIRSIDEAIHQLQICLRYEH